MLAKNVHAVIQSFKFCKRQISIPYAYAFLFAFLIAKAAISAEPPFASNAEQLPSVWTLPELQQLAVESNPTIRQVIAEVNVFRGYRKQAGLYPNPQVGYVHTNSNGSAPVRARGAFVSQEIVTAGKLKKAQSVQDAEIAHANANYDAQCRRVRNDVELRFLDAYFLQESIALADQSLDIARRDFEATEVRRKRKKKKAELSELIQAKMRLRTSSHTVSNLQIQSETAWQQLTSVVGRPDLPRAELTWNQKEEVPELDWETCWSTIVTTNPLISAAFARHQIASGNYALERANAIPNLNAQIIADRDSAQGTSTVSALISIPLPVFNRNQGSIDRAIAETHEAVAEKERTYLVLRDQLSEAFGRYKLAKAHLIEIRDEFLPMATENLAAIQQEFIDDQKAPEVFEAESTLIDAKISLLEARAELHKSVAEIRGQLLTGALNPAEVGAALQSHSGSDVRRNVFRQSEKLQSKQLVPGLQLLSE